MRVQLLARGRFDAQLEQEAIELRLGQRVGALHLDRVLRRQHEERRRQRVGLLADRDRLLLHRLEQRRLRLGRGAVDLVGEHDVREDRPVLELEAARRLARRAALDDHVGADDVGGHQVGRELDARERQVQRLGQRAHQQRLAQARARPRAARGRPRAARRRPRPRCRLPDHAAPDLGEQAVDVGAEGGDGRQPRTSSGGHAIGRGHCLRLSRSTGARPDQIEVATDDIAPPFGDRGRGQRVLDRRLVVREDARVALLGEAAVRRAANHLGAVRSRAVRDARFGLATARLHVAALAERGAAGAVSLAVALGRCCCRFRGSRGAAPPLRPCPRPRLSEPSPCCPPPRPFPFPFPSPSPWPSATASPWPWPLPGLVPTPSPCCALALTLLASLTLALPRLSAFAAGGALEAAHRGLIAAAQLAASEALAHLPQRPFEAAQRFGAGAAPGHPAQIFAPPLGLGPAVRIAVAARLGGVVEIALQPFQAALVGAPVSGRADSCRPPIRPAGTAGAGFRRSLRSRPVRRARSRRRARPLPARVLSPSGCRPPPGPARRAPGPRHRRRCWSAPRSRRAWPPRPPAPARPLPAPSRRAPPAPPPRPPRAAAPTACPARRRR